ncbi:MAG: F0F1 ATP synthase subunit delta [Firmicutes bacterium]|nr:F0F1 ATP synthase subunit delta [Bacillota bacterium]
MAELVGKRYGSAFFQLAKEENIVKEMYEEFEFVNDTVKNEKDLKILLESPRLNADEKKEIVENIFSGKVNDKLLGLLKLIIEKRRIKSLNDIFNEFKTLVDKDNNKIKATAVTVVKMKDKELNDLKSLLEEKLNQKVELKNVIDKTLLGGVLLRIGDRVIDGSIKRRMELLREDLLKIKVI